MSLWALADLQILVWEGGVCVCICVAANIEDPLTLAWS